VSGPLRHVSRDVGAAVELHRRAQSAASNKRPAAAVSLLRTALERLGPAGNLAGEWLEIRTRVLISMAAAEAEITSLDAGLAHLDGAEETRLRLPVGTTRSTLRFTVGLQKSLMLARAGRLTEALALFDAIMPSLEKEISDDGVLLTKTLLNRAWVHLQMSNPVAALVDLNWALELSVANGQTVFEGKVRHNLGDHAQLVGDIPEALRQYELAARIFSDAGPGSLPLVKLDQAKALLAAGLAEEAARHLDDALPGLQANGVVQDLAEAEVARAAAAILENDFPLAHRFADAARRRFLRRGNIRWAEIAALTKLRADTAAALENPRRLPAPSLPTKLSELAVRLVDLGLRDEAAAARLLAVRVHLRRHDVESAQALLKQVPKPRETTPVDHKMLLRLCRAELALATGRPRSALAQARAGLNELGGIRDKMGGLDLLCGTAVHGQQLGRLAVRLVVGGARNQRGARSVFAWLERTRAQVYRYEPLPIIEDPALAKYLTEMRQVQRAIQQNRLAGNPATALELHYAWLRGEASRLGWYSSQWGRPRPVSSPDEVAERLGGRVLISLFTDGDSLAAVAVRDGKFRLVRLGPLEEVIEAGRQLHADLDALAPDQLPEPLAEAVIGSAQRRAKLLDRLVIDPLAELFGDRQLVIVPIGRLYALPWGALPSLRGRPVSIVPSATAWVSAFGRRSAGNVLLAGGPGVPGAIGEVRKLRSVYPEARLVDGPDATSATVLGALEGAGMAHLVAHGAHEPANAMFSRLELVDGPLFAHETARLRRPPEHVVLAACELAMSHIRPGEEALGFAGTLLAGGSRTVIGAVSRVGDIAAAGAMSDLHRLLSIGTSPAVALAEATAVDPLRRPFLCLGAG
jgi:tetratricopeptide (TPR) repeat protein